MSEQYAKQTAHEPGLLRAGRADGTDSALPAEALRRPQAPLRPSEAAATVPAYSPLSADAAAPPVCVVNPFNPCERATVLLFIDECGNLIVCVKR